jgi:hypothetical protein
MTTTVFDLDVLIVGGGVQGLWQLRELLNAGYSALLVEKGELGGKQTCHSHAYLHQGHLYNEVSFAERLKEIQPIWDGWLKSAKSTPVRGSLPSYFGFLNPSYKEKKLQLWESPQLMLPFKQCTSIPSPLKGGVITEVLESPETCLDSTWLVGELVSGVEDHVSQISEVVNITAVNNRIESVELRMLNDHRLTIGPRALVFAAGAGNQSLLDAIKPLPVRTIGATKSQQIRKSHMLVIKGKSDELEALTGVFPDLQLFIVSRFSKDSVVWLVSDNNSPTLRNEGDWVRYDASWWLNSPSDGRPFSIIEAIQKLAPRFFLDSPDRLRWGVYEAPKAEGVVNGGGIPSEERIEHFGIDNLWTVWPTKLTLAPRASQEIVKEIHALLRGGKPCATSLWDGWLKIRALPATATESWSRTPLSEWGDFCRFYNIDL